jgi:hypothetical protein
MILFSIPGRPVWPNTGSDQPTAADAHVHLALHNRAGGRLPASLMVP